MTDAGTARRGVVDLLEASPTDARDATSSANSFVLPEQRIVFVDVAKNASTSIKWLLAEIRGQDLERFRTGSGFAPTPRQTIHRRAAWRDVPRLQDLDAELRREISPDNGWFVFGVVRDPRLRAWSAWQSKFLVGNPLHTRVKFPDAPWLPRVPRSDRDVVEDFRRFVDVLGGPGGVALLADSHFAPQVRLLREDVVPYSNLYETSGLPTLLTDLRHHLESVGAPRRCELSRENETPLAVAGRAFGPDVLPVLERVYRDDLARFGHLWDFAGTLAKDAEWSADAFRDVAARVSAGRRVADLAERAQRVREERADLASTLRRSRAAHGKLQRELDRARTRGAQARDDRRAARAKLAEVQTQNAELRARVAQLEAALHSRTLRGFPGAVVRRLRGTVGPARR